MLLGMAFQLFSTDIRYPIYTLMADLREDYLVDIEGVALQLLHYTEKIQPLR